MLFLRRPTKERIDQWLLAQQKLTLNYPEVGGTREEPPPSGRYNLDRYRIQLGHGEETYRRAMDAIQGLHMWDFPWVQICWRTTPVEVGSVLATLTRQVGVWFLNACRIVYLMDETEPWPRYGFAYGTVRGHIEHGEERFMVEWHKDRDDSVWYEILAFSRPSHWLMRVGYPYMRRVQRRFGASSTQAIADLVRSGEPVDVPEADLDSPGAPIKDD